MAGRCIVCNRSYHIMLHFRSILVAVALITGSLLPASAQAPQGQKVGTLTCKLSPSIGLIIGSRQRMACRVAPDRGGQPDEYLGVMGRIGLDIGITMGGGLAWAVFASTTGPLRGALAGTYVGAS